MVNHPVVRLVAERVLKATRYETRVLESTDRFDPAEVKNCSLLVIGESTLRASIGRILQDLRLENPTLRIGLLNEEESRRDALHTILRERVEHLVARDVNQEEALFATLSKLLLGNYFGIRKYLLWGAATRSWQVSEASQKATVFDEIREMAGAVNCHPRIVDLLVSAVDEMIINSLYLVKEPDRRGPITVECGSDGRLLAVAVVDPYGLFEPGALYRALGQALEQERGGMPLDAASGSLGFRTMLATLSHLVINVDPGSRTEMIGLVDLRKSLKDYRRTAPSLGMFSAPSRER
jgi:hypothetical protein